MLPLLALATSLSAVQPSSAVFGVPLGDTEMAYVAPGAVIRPDQAPIYQELPARLSTWEQIDCWWAYDGAAMIAEAVRPTPALPQGFDANGLHQVSGIRHLRVDVTASGT